jgi:hypothetical protein
MFELGGEQSELPPKQLPRTDPRCMGRTLAGEPGLGQHPLQNGLPGQPSFLHLLNSPCHNTFDSVFNRLLRCLN